MSLFGPPNIEKMVAKKDISGLIKALNSDLLDKPTGTPIWYLASDAICAFDGTESINHLLEVLRDTKAKLEYKHRVVETLIKISNPIAVQSLIRFGYDPNLDIINKLKNAKKENWDEFLANVLKTRSSEEKGAWFRAFAKVKDPTLVKISANYDINFEGEDSVAFITHFNGLDESILEFAENQLENGKFVFADLVVRSCTDWYSEEVTNFLINCLKSNNWELIKTVVLYSKYMKCKKTAEYTDILEKSATAFSEQQLYRYPESWISNPEYKSFLIQILNNWNVSAPGSQCPYFTLGLCMFRVQSKKDNSMGPEKCSLEWPPDKNKWNGWNHRNCFVWQMDPK